MSDRLWVNDERNLLVRLWDNGTVEVAMRQGPGFTWGPPEYLTEENTQASAGRSSGEAVQATRERDQSES